MEPGLEGSYQNPRVEIPGLIAPNIMKSPDMEIYRGDDFLGDLPVEIDGVPIDPTTGQLFWTLNRRDERAECWVLQKTFQNGGFPQIGLGVVTLFLTHDDTICLLPTTYVWDLTWIDSQGRKKTLLFGVLTILVKPQANIGMPQPTPIEQTGSFTIPQGEASFIIPFPVNFFKTPSFVDIFIVPPDGQPAIDVHNRTPAINQIAVTLEAATPVAGYVANWFAKL